MIKIENINKIFNQNNTSFHALSNINLTLEGGKIHGIIGESGAGKSTLLRCLNRLETPTSGKITLDNTDILSLDKKELLTFRKNIGMIFQSFNLLNSKTVFDNVAFPLKLAGVAKGEIKKRVCELLELVSISDKESSYPSQLSGGQKQRVAIARALANNPKYLLCDEATSALDPSTTKQILGLLKEINTKLDITIVLITHEMEVIKEICHTVTQLIDGKCIYTGDCATFFMSYEKESHKKALVTEKRDIISSCSGRVLYLTFDNETSKIPAISKISRDLQIDINIINGQIDRVGNSTFGNLVVEILNDDISIDSVMDNLKKLDVSAEVIK